MIGSVSVVLLSAARQVTATPLPQWAWIVLLVLLAGAVIVCTLAVILYYLDRRRDRR